MQGLSIEYLLECGVRGGRWGVRGGRRGGGEERIWREGRGLSEARGKRWLYGVSSHHSSHVSLPRHS